jgi:hypothetical protein
VELPYSLRLSVISHFYSPLPLNLRLPTSGLAGGIFITDVTGDGTGDGTAVSNGGVGDLVPGTKLGAFGRSVSAGDINNLITNYNSNFAGTPTPAGQALITASLFTKAQLDALGGVQQPLCPAPPIPRTDPACPNVGNGGQVGMSWLRALDLKLSWPIKVREGLILEPIVSFFNAFNLANFDSPTSELSGILDGSNGTANGTTASLRAAGNTRIGVGTGVFGLGAPRQLEFGLRLTF